MAAGKNKLTRYARVYVGGYDLSGDVRTFNSLDFQAPEVDMTGLSNAVNNFLAGHRQVGVRGYQAYMNDATGGASAVMQPPASHVVSVFLGGGAAPAAGDMAYLLPGVQLADAAEFSAAVGMFSTDMPLDAAVADGNYRTPWGKVLLPLTALTATTNGTAVDLGAAGTLGGHATLHVTAAGTTWAFVIQQSATGLFAGEETTLLTFASTGGAVGGEWKSVSGNVARYVRLVATKTTGNVTIAAAFAVNR
jgi:hypothetical protein